MPFLILDGLDKRFGDHTVLRRVSLEVEEGEVVALLGPSGSGKTTLLRLLAGFETPDAGRIRLAGDDVTALSPERRRFGMVFQHYALFPHLSVGENVAFGLRARRRDRGEVERRVAEALALVDLDGFEERRPGEISGGQQQRVALARALAIEPRVLLLDEPLSNLDPALRERTRRELAADLRRVGVTTVLVTHEQEEAFDLGDRVAVLHDGRLDQVGTPEELYETPATRFVATFVGRAAVLPGRVEEGGRVRLAGTGVPWRAACAGLAVGSSADLVVRPEALAFAAAGAEGALPGRVLSRRYAGPVTYYRLELDAGPEVEVAVSERHLTGAGTRVATPGESAHVAPLPDGPLPRAFATHDDGNHGVVGGRGEGGGDDTGSPPPAPGVTGSVEGSSGASGPPRGGAGRSPRDLPGTGADR